MISKLRSRSFFECRELLDKNAIYFKKKCSSTLRGWIFPIITPKLSSPIFVVGCSRSGTTAVYKTFSQSSELASMDRESHDFWNSLKGPEQKGWTDHSLNATDVVAEDVEKIRRFYFTHLGSGRFVDKANQNTFRISYLASIFPDSKFVCVFRNGYDNINSLIHGWGLPDQYGIAKNRLPFDIRVENGKYREWCFFLFPGWTEHLNASIERVCAEQWLAANCAIRSGKNHLKAEQWIEIKYENMLTHPVETFEEAFHKAGLSFNMKMEAYCRDLVSNPFNAFSKPRIGKWKQENNDKIMKIKPLIRGMMNDLGYEDL